MVFNCYGFHIPQCFVTTKQRRKSGCFKLLYKHIVCCFEPNLKNISEIGSYPQFLRCTSKHVSNHHVCHKNHHFQHTKSVRFALTKVRSRDTPPSCSKLLQWKVFNCKPDSHNQAVFFCRATRATKRSQQETFQLQVSLESSVQSGSPRMTTSGNLDRWKPEDHLQHS